MSINQVFIRHNETYSSEGASTGVKIIDPKCEPSRVTVMSYNKDEYVEVEITDIEQIPGILEKHSTTWINVEGLGDIEEIKKISKLFNIHELALEDVLSRRQRAKVEDFDHQIFVVVRMADFSKTIDLEQVSIFIGENYVLTFQEQAGDCLNPVRDRIKKPSGKIRERGAGYLAYAIIDAVIDGYFPVIEEIGERIEDLEDEILLEPSSKLVSEIHEIKRNLLRLRRVTWPIREVVNALSREDEIFIDDITRIYLRDCYDHAIQVMDLIESYRDITSGLMDVYLSSVSNRMNEIMKVLTIIATIFMPLTFIAGIYGMNFNTEISKWNMPELNWAFGYPFSLVLMLVITGWMVVYFRNRGWLGPFEKEHQK